MPVIEIISRQLYYYGFDKVAVSLGHLSDIVKLFLESKSRSSGMPEFEYFTEFKSKPNNPSQKIEKKLLI